MAGSETKSVKDLSIEEFKALIVTTVRQVLEDEIEKGNLSVKHFTVYIEKLSERKKKGTVLD